MEALLLGLYYFMCKCAVYKLRLVRMYVTLVFLGRKGIPSRGPSLTVFFSKSRIFLNLLFLRYLLLGVFR